CVHLRVFLDVTQLVARNSAVSVESISGLPSSWRLPPSNEALGGGAPYGDSLETEVPPSGASYVDSLGKGALIGEVLGGAYFGIS
ncbi:hypothetical protein HAX54_020538, partial [Datura stramonium]|nr:hypothetical protein [Datura stramonium]